MKRVYPPRGFVCVLGLLVLLCVGCAPQGGVPPTATGSSAAGALKVALILPGQIDDRSWSQSGFEGLTLIERELGAQVTYRAGVAEGDAEHYFRSYAEQGYDLVIGHGAQFYPAAEAAAAGFPRTKFAVIGDFPGNNRNLAAVNFRNAENGYLVGVVAALKTRSDHIAYIGGVENEGQLAALDALARGAQATKPSIKVSRLWVGSWTDEQRAGELAREALRAGADVLIQNADSAGVAVFNEATTAGVFAIGWAQDQHELAPQTIVTSAIQRVPVLLREAAILVQRGRFEGKLYRFGLQEGALDIAPDYGLLSDEERTLLKTIREDIIAGRIVVE